MGPSRLGQRVALVDLDPDGAGADDVEQVRRGRQRGLPGSPCRS